jgi:hypothetical protein
MGYILAILSVPIATGTGIYKPDVMHNGRCIAEPGSYQALYCPPGSDAPGYRIKRKKN